MAITEATAPTATFVAGDTETIDYTPGSAVAAGDVVVVGNSVYFAKLAIDASDLGALHIGGRWRLPKSTGTSSGWAQGTRLYWDTVSTVVTETADSLKTIGIAAATAADDDTTAEVVSIPQV